MEASHLKDTLKRKRHDVSRGVSYWLFFKAHILEKQEVRNAFEERALDFEGFRAW